MQNESPSFAAGDGIGAFWADVREMEKTILAACAKPDSGQPRGGGSCFVTSRESRKSRMNGGVLSEVTIRLGAQRCVEESHTLSTKKEIDDHLEKEKARVADMAATAARTRSTISFAPPIYQSQGGKL